MGLLSGKNAIVTGSNRGIGKAIVSCLAENGANIWACARKANSNFESELHELSRENNVWILPIYYDLTNPEQIKEAFKTISLQKKNIDILVNCAGISSSFIFQMTSVNLIRDIFEVNVFAAMELTQYCLKCMTRQKSGSIINVASISGIDAHPAKAVYGSSKAALIHFTKALASEVGKQGIRVNAIAPGPTDTDMIRKTFDTIGDSILERCAMGRLAKPEEIAQVVAFLASDQSSFVNGQVIRIDGGTK